MNQSAPINSRLNVVVQSLTPFGLVRNGCWPFRECQLPGHALHTNYFFAVLPPNDRRRKHTASLKSVDCFCLFFSYLSFARLLILLLLMSGNVHPSPGLVFSYLVCAENVTWRDRSVRCCACSKWIHLRCSLLFFSKFKALGSSHTWSCLPYCGPASCGGPTPTNTVAFSSGPSACILPLFNMVHLAPLPMQRSLAITCRHPSICPLCIYPLCITSCF